MEVIFTLAGIDEIAGKVLDAMGGDKVMALHGEMGTGKTTLIHALCRQLGVQEPVTSPTFSIINEYKTFAGGIIYHMDLYRLSNSAEAVNAGVEDCLLSGNTCFVEWPEIAPGILPPGTFHVYLTLVKEATRRLVTGS